MGDHHARPSVRAGGGELRLCGVHRGRRSTLTAGRVGQSHQTLRHRLVQRHAFRPHPQAGQVRRVMRIPSHREATGNPQASSVGFHLHYCLTKQILIIYSVQFLSFNERRLFFFFFCIRSNVNCSQLGSKIYFVGSIQ